MIRKLHILITLLIAMLVQGIAIPVHAQEPDVLEIDSQEKLEAFRTAVNGGNTYEGDTVKLTNSFEVDNWTVGIGVDVYGNIDNDKPFLGTFDGQGHVVTMRTGCITSLFVLIGNENNANATVKNLGVAGTLNNTSDDSSTKSIGGIANKNYGTIEQCYTSATISSSYGFTGGIAEINKGTIRNCYSTGAITSNTKSAGGIAETNSGNGTIQNCYSTGTVTANNNAGGIAGQNFSSIQYCIALNGSISGKSKGRIAGINGGILTDNYASPKIQDTWPEEDINGIPLTAENFTGQTAGQGAFTGWTDTDWDFTNTANLPILKGFSSNAPAQPAIPRPTIEAALIKEIKNDADLKKFRDAVNSGETYEGETVTLKASFTVDAWAKGIGNWDDQLFQGTFDGGGNVITLTNATASLFLVIGNNGTVENLGVTGTVTASSGAGGIATDNSGMIQNCFTSVNVTSTADTDAGGIAASNGGTIRNCYTTGAITGAGNAGGIAGNNGSVEGSPTLSACYATGTITGNKAGGIVGRNGTGGKTEKCIALNTGGSGTTPVVGRIAGINDNGTLTGNYASPAIPGTWDNDAKNGADLTEGNFITNATAVGGAFYGWNNGNTAWDFSTNSANLPTLTGFQPDVKQPVADITRKSLIKTLLTNITSAKDLATFRDAVNSGETYKGETVTLANDITVTDWITGIGIEADNKNDNKPFSGTFDGQGHVINLTGSTSLFALIDKVDETYGTVKNLGVNAAITANTTNVGGIVGHNYGTIQNCYTKGTITNDSYYTGGIAGDNGGTIQNCYSTALCTGNNATGGIVGKHSGTILQCYATGAINGKESAGGIAGTFAGNKELKNCIALNTSITFTDTKGKSGRIISSPTVSYLSNNHATPLLPGTLDVMKADKKDGADLTEENFIDVTTATGVFTDWGDTDWDLTTTDLPTLKVFKDANNPQPAKGITRKEMLMKLTIDSPEDLFAFCVAVNGGESYEGEAVTLTKDITVTDWKDAISCFENRFLGTFDGGGHTITMGEGCESSLFSYLGTSDKTAGTLQNLGVKGTIPISGIVDTNYGKIRHCYTEGTVGSETIEEPTGGIAGVNYGTIENCYSTADITANASAGGIAGESGGTSSSILNSYATGTIKGTKAGGIMGSNGEGVNPTIKNCIALNKSIEGSESKNRILSGSSTNLSGNYASLLIPGKWDKKKAIGLDGADLTSASFINVTTATGVFADWPTGDDGWDLTTDNLPTLKGFTAAQSVASITRISKTLLLSIASADELDIFRTAVAGGETYEDKTVTLTGDITVEKWETGIEGPTYSKPFLGTFDGAGHVINLSGSASLFTVLGKSGNEKGTVQNLGVKVKIEATGDVSDIGGIVNTNYGTIKQCYTTGEISGDYAGGIVVQNHKLIQDCYSTVAITVETGAGGIVQNNSGTVERCYATGAITAGDDGTGGIVGVNNGRITKCISLNESIKASSKSGRITGNNDDTLADNFAGPLIPGTWSNKEGNKLDGADLTEATFIGQGAGQGAFAEWSDDSWEFGDNSNLPKLKTIGLAPNIVIGGQGDGSGNMPARAGFLENIIEISGPVTYDADTHNGKIIRVKANGKFTVNADGVSLKKLTIDEGGEVITTTGFTCGQLLAPRILGNKWTAYGSPVTMQAVATTKQDFYNAVGYFSTQSYDQEWSQISQSIASYDVVNPSLIATENKEVPVVFTASAADDSQVSIPADKAATEGENLYTGIFQLCPNPTLKNVTLPVAYILNDDGTRFEREENVEVKPFQSYMIANKVTSAAVLSIRTGNSPTSNDKVPFPDSSFRLWGSNGQLHLSADHTSEVTIYDLSGRLIRQFILTGKRTLNLGRGLYLVRSNNITYKVSL